MGGTVSDRDALLAMILAHPAEDTPRLVYADWLEENDQPERAEFIRVQIQNATDEVRGLAKCNRQWEIQFARAQELLERYWDEWCLPLNVPYVDAPWFHRGFVVEIFCTVSEWRKRAKAIRAKHPIEKVTIRRFNRSTATTVSRMWRERFNGSPQGIEFAQMLADCYPGITFMLEVGLRMVRSRPVLALRSL